MCDLATLSVFLPLICAQGGTDSFSLWMSGTWEGTGRFVHIDAERMLGNLDPERRFQRDTLILTALNGRHAVFRIGESRFEGDFDGATLRLWREGTGAPETLMRTELSPTSLAGLPLRSTLRQ